MESILRAAEEVLAVDPSASLAVIAERAGLARATVHRRFSTRAALVESLVLSVVTRIEAAIDAARPESAPPAVALHEATANVLRVKATWRFAATQGAPTPEIAEVKRRSAAKGAIIFRRAREAGLIRRDADLDWVQRVHQALLTEAASGRETESDPDLLAARVVETLLRGCGPG
jgi:AcrR family transcriptional regulator